MNLLQVGKRMAGMYWYDARLKRTTAFLDGRPSSSR
jgi:hypothetical protein